MCGAAAAAAKLMYIYDLLVASKVVKFALRALGGVPIRNSGLVGCWANSGTAEILCSECTNDRG